MTNLNSEVAEQICSEYRAEMLDFLVQVDRDIGAETASSLDILREGLNAARTANENGPDEILNDLYVLDRYLDFFTRYGLVWKLIARQQFADSWDALQDALDCLRLIRRFSAIDISEFEDQLIELEKSFPYHVFFSIGAAVESFECSICGQDMDSFDCPHRKGYLYRGHMAYGIARKITNFDHVALVEKPEDKRCVVKYEDTSEQFSIVRFIAQLLLSRKMKVSEFGRLLFSKRSIPNPEYRKVGRNAPCYCGSGKKFKTCCVSKAYIESDHVDVLPHPIVIERAVA
ncbi:MAG: SEC-C metal-binding domain-containing protein [Pseudomonadota bacterium]